MWKLGPACIETNLIKLNSAAYSVIQTYKLEKPKYNIYSETPVIISNKFKIGDRIQKIRVVCLRTGCFFWLLICVIPVETGILNTQSTFLTAPFRILFQKIIYNYIFRRILNIDLSFQKVHVVFDKYRKWATL